MSTRPHEPMYQKSSYSTPGNCVEVALAPDVVRVRDTKDRDGGTLALPSPAWAAFLGGCKHGEFDR